MNHIRKKDHIYDVVIIGSSLSGLMTAVSLLNDGLDVCVLESAEFSGGHSRLVYSPIGLIDNGLKFFPHKANSLSALKQLNSILKTPVEFGAVENGPITYQGGDLKPFVGFGKEAPEFHRELNYFLEPQRLELSRSLGQIASELTMTLGDRVHTGSIVTKYLGEAGRMNSVMVNGQKQIYARKFVHAISPKFLATLLSDELLSSRAKQKVAKADYWTVVGLDLFHEGMVTESTLLHLLNGTTQDDIGPCVGLFHSAVPSVKNPETLVQLSQWMTFMNEESGEDPEQTGATLKKIKRQIKRAYPQALDHLISERIWVAPLVEADVELKWDTKGALHGVSNLWVAHGSASAGLNLVGSIEQAMKVASQLGPLAQLAPMAPLSSNMENTDRPSSVTE